MFHRNSKNGDPTRLKATTEGGETEVLNYKTDKHDYRNILKSFRIDKEIYGKKRVQTKWTY